MPSLWSTPGLRSVLVLGDDYRMTLQAGATAPSRPKPAAASRTTATMTTGRRRRRERGEKGRLCCCCCCCCTAAAVPDSIVLYIQRQPTQGSTGSAAAVNESGTPTASTTGAHQRRASICIPRHPFTSFYILYCWLHRDVVVMEEVKRLMTTTTMTLRMQPNFDHSYRKNAAVYSSTLPSDSCNFQYFCCRVLCVSSKKQHGKQSVKIRRRPVLFVLDLPSPPITSRELR